MTQKKLFAHPPLVIRIARIAAIAYALFLSIFALDVFEPGLSAGQILTALGMHLLPSLAILLFLWIAWKNPLIGGMLFILVGIAYIIEAGGQSFLTYLLIAGIPILIGIFFLWGYRQNRRV
jgi:hypothetical protein